MEIAANVVTFLYCFVQCTYRVHHQPGTDPVIRVRDAILQDVNGFSQSSDTLDRFPDGFWISFSVRLINSAVPLGNMWRYEYVSKKLGGMPQAESDMKPAVNVQTNKIARALHFFEMGCSEVERQ